MWFVLGFAAGVMVTVAVVYAWIIAEALWR